MDCVSIPRRDFIGFRVAIDFVKVAIVFVLAVSIPRRDFIGFRAHASDWEAGGTIVSIPRRDFIGFRAGTTSVRIRSRRGFNP